jgi:hypothetical protein
VALFAQAARVKRWFPPERAPYSRRGYREKRRKFARANWKALAVLLVVFAAMGALLSWTMHGYALGAAHATLMLINVGMTVSISHATTTGTVGLLAGAWGEENTRDLLRRAQRKRLIWGWIDGIATAAGDISITSLLRAAVLVAIDSKWRNDVTRKRLESDASAAANAARRANSILRSIHVPVGMTPVVVVWGGARAEVPPNACVDGVDFIGGHRVLEWLKGLPSEEVDKASARELVGRLYEFRDRVRQT